MDTTDKPSENFKYYIGHQALSYRRDFMECEPVLKDGLGITKLISFKRLNFPSLI